MGDMRAGGLQFDGCSMSTVSFIIMTVCNVIVTLIN